MSTLGRLKAFGQSGVVKTSATSPVEVRNWQAGASLPLGAGRLLAWHGNSRRDLAAPQADRTSTTLTLGYDRALSKRTLLHGITMTDACTGLSRGTTDALGVRHTS